MTEMRKGTALPAVTTLADTDSLMAFGADGQAKRITSKNFKETQKMAAVQGAEWIRVLAVPGAGSVGIFAVTNLWFNTAPQPVMFAYVVPHANWSAPNGSMLEKIIGKTGVITQVRFVYKPNAGGTNDVFIEVKPSGTSDRTFVVDAMLGFGAKVLCEAGEIPEGYTAKVFDLNGGGKRLTLRNICERRRAAA